MEVVSIARISVRKAALWKAEILTESMAAFYVLSEVAS
jgi:hypothetical protein